MQSVDEVILIRRLLDVLYLLEVLMHVLCVDVWHIKLVQIVALLYNYSNLIFFTYIHCLTCVVGFLVVVRRFYRQRETWVAREENSLSWLVRGWVRSLKNLKYDTTHTPHVLRLVILFLQQRYFRGSVPSGADKVWDWSIFLAGAFYNMSHFLQENLSHVILKEVRVKSALSNWVSYSCGVTTAFSRQVFWEWSGDTEVTDFDPHVCSYEEIGWLNISVYYIKLM